MNSRLLHHVETIVIVTLVTILVWVYAEGENVQEHDNYGIRMRFVSPPGQNLAIEPKGAVTIRLTLRCSASQLAKVNDRVASELPIELNAGQKTIDLKAALEEEFRQIGVEVVSARADSGEETLSVRAEPIVIVTRSIDANWPKDITIASETLSQETVSIRGPRSVIEQLPDQPVLLDWSAHQDLNGELGVIPIRRDFSLPVMRIGALADADIRIEPSRVTASAVVSRKLSRTSIKTVPIVLQMPGTMNERFAVELVDNPNWVLPVDVTIVGSPEVVSRIEAREITIRAILRLSVAELEDLVERKAVVFDLPEGVQAETSPPELELKITDLTDNGG